MVLCYQYCRLYEKCQYQNMEPLQYKLCHFYLQQKMQDNHLDCIPKSVFHCYKHLLL